MRQLKFGSVRGAFSRLRRVNVTPGRVAAATAVLGGGAYALRVSRRRRAGASATSE